jgi:hypothetical protein
MAPLVDILQIGSNATGIYGLIGLFISSLLVAFVANQHSSVRKTRLLLENANEAQKAEIVRELIRHSRFVRVLVLLFVLAGAVCAVLVVLSVREYFAWAQASDTIVIGGDQHGQYCFDTSGDSAASTYRYAVYIGDSRLFWKAITISHGNLNEDDCVGLIVTRGDGGERYLQASFAKYKPTYGPISDKPVKMRRLKS